MVKIPGLDDLKKMGSGILDSAKSIKLTEMVDKVRTGVESVSGKGGAIPQGDEAIKTAFQGVYAGINEVLEMQSAQSQAIKKLQGQIADLARVIDATQKAGTQTTTTTVSVETNSQTTPTNSESEKKP